MRKFFVATVVIFFLLVNNFCSAQNPSYTLRAINFASEGPDAIVFDIYIENNDNTIPLKYMAGQFAFNIDTSFFNGGKIKFSIAAANTGDSSDLPFELRPRNAVIDYDMNGNPYLRTSSMPSFDYKEGLEIPVKGSPGTKIIRMKIGTTAESFSDSKLNLSWRNKPDNIYTKIYGFDGKISKDFTEPEKHIEINTEINK